MELCSASSTGGTGAFEADTRSYLLTIRLEVGLTDRNSRASMPTRSEAGRRSTPSFAFQLAAPADAHTIAALCRSVRLALEETDDVVLVCDLRMATTPDVTLLDALARMQLTARRVGGSIQLRHACPQLQELLRLTGLTEVFPLVSELPLEAQGQVEQGEQLGGDEGVDRADALSCDCQHLDREGFQAAGRRVGLVLGEGR